jgi:hypothetical protein
MLHETTTDLPVPEIIARAKAFFAERVPHHAAFPEKEGPGFVTLRGQGGEEVAIAVWPSERGQRVRASTLFYDQAVQRFLATLPASATAPAPSSRVAS